MERPNLEIADTGADPLDLVEQILSLEGYVHERADDAEVHFGLPGQWSDLHGFFATRAEPPTLVLTLGLDIRTPAPRVAECCRLIALINEQCWLGHFELWAEDGAIVFRHVLPLIDRDEATPGEIAAVLAAAVDSANRFTPAFNFLIWAGKSPEEAAAAALFETVGEA
jgi:hypothetical protein